MATIEHYSPQVVIARVRTVSEDGRHLCLDLRNGSNATVDGTEPFEFSPGSVVFLRTEDNHIEAAPADVWPEETWVGVVRLTLSDATVVDSGGRWRKVPNHGSVSHSVGNTVEVQDSRGIIRVLSETAIRFIDAPALDDASIAKFRTHEDTLDVNFDDFGGLSEVVARARELIETPLTSGDALSAIGARPVKGVLFTGLPGTGKTMLARIIANRSGAAFYEISGPEIFSKWFGQSEELLRRIFDDAASQSRSILFFDEIDSVASHRSDSSHEASRRVVAQLLTLMDGFKSKSNVIVIAATNRPQDLDAALRRPGRFDWEVHFPLPSRRDRELILQSSSRRLRTHGTLPHEWVAEKTESWSAAELAAIWTEAALLAVRDSRRVLISEDYIGGFERVAKQRHRVGGSTSGGGTS
jgi:transitional endoplasmic reticulum ATPase